MQKRKEDEKGPKNDEGRELWLDDTTLNEVAKTSDEEESEDSLTGNEDEN